MDIIELFIDEDDQVSGIDAISIVENPAIQEDFVYLKNQEFKLAELDKEKRLLLGPALIPNKPIYRKSADKEYYIYFSRNTVRKASELFLKRQKQNRSTLEHELPLNGLTVVESWIVEGEQDKTKMYDMDVPLGTWMVSMKVENDDVWENYVKTGKVKGFSIEGYFADKLERPNEPNKLSDCGCEQKLLKCICKDEEIKEIEEKEAKELLSAVKAIIKQDKRYKSGKKTELETYNDYPDAVANNAKRGIELNKKVNNKCATQVGKVRAQQLARKQKLSVETIKRMYSYLSRAEEYYKTGDKEACGYISYLLWGGKSAKSWAERKLRSLDKLSLASIVIDGKRAYDTKQEAIIKAEEMGCEGFHEHEVNGQTWYMPCETHEQELKKPCQAGYEMIGFKMKNGRRVPNCVPIK